MSYCVNCGVELDETASECPLCQTLVYNPNCSVNKTAPLPFPSNRQEVLPVSKKELALVATTLMAAASASCGIMNVFFFFPSVAWSVYIAGLLAMIWVWVVFPLFQKRSVKFRFVVDLLTLAGYLAVIAATVNGWDWYVRLVLPVVGLIAVLFGGFGLVFWNKRSALSGCIAFIGLVGVFLLVLEPLIDIWNSGMYTPGWSVVTSAVSVSLMLPLVVIRWRPALREEMKKRFHL